MQHPGPGAAKKKKKANTNQTVVLPETMSMATIEKKPAKKKKKKKSTKNNEGLMEMFQTFSKMNKNITQGELDNLHQEAKNKITEQIDINKPSTYFSAQMQHFDMLKQNMENHVKLIEYQ